jgi:hypothetical protein
MESLIKTMTPPKEHQEKTPKSADLGPGEEQEEGSDQRSAELRSVDLWSDRCSDKCENKTPFQPDFSLQCALLAYIHP